MMHPIEHLGNVSLSLEDGKEKYMTDVLHVPTITKNFFLLVKWLSTVCKSDLMSMAVLLKILEISAGWLLKATRMEECLNSF